MAVAVSVLVPVCNVERYLRECLDSLVAQTLRDIEIICIDDGSTDSSGAIIDEYCDRYSNFRVIHKPNTGYGNSMNCGLDIAQGEYVGIVESDDFADKRMFAVLYRIAKRHDLDVVKSSYYEHSEAGDTRCAPYHGLKYGRVLDPVTLPEVFGTTPAIWTGLYRRSFLVDAGIRFVESPGASFQDTGFIYKIWSAAKRCMLLRRAFLHYRIDNAGSSVKSTKKVFALCDEHASVDAFLESLPEDRALAAARGMQQARFGTYRWNYNRIAEESRLEFVVRVADEFKAAKVRGWLDEGLFKPANWALLEQLMADPEVFCAAYPDELPWEF